MLFKSIAVTLPFLLQQAVGDSIVHAPGRYCRAKTQTTISTTPTNTTKPTWQDTSTAPVWPPKDPITTCSDISDLKIPYWSLSCSDDGLLSADTDVPGYLGEITLNWTILGLEEAMLEAVSYAYNNHLDDFITLLDEISNVQISISQIDNISMKAVFFASSYNNAEIGVAPSNSSSLNTTLPNARVRTKRQGTVPTYVLNYDSATGASAPALAGYLNVRNTKSTGGTSFWPIAMYTFEDPRQFGQPVAINAALDICVEHYAAVLLLQVPSLRSDPHTFSVGIVRTTASGRPNYTVKCYFNPQLFANSKFDELNDERKEMVPYTIISQDLYVYERQEPCIFDTNMVQDPPECLWTEYGSKYILETVAAKSNDGYRFGFFDSFIQNLGVFANDGQQGFRMDCDLLTGCTVPPPPSAKATNAQVGAFMITNAIFQHYSATRLLFETFDVGSQWASAILPGIVDTLRIPQTQPRPDNDSFDVLSFFNMILGECPLGKVGDALGGFISWYQFIDALRGPPIPPIQIPQTDLFELSIMFAQTSTLVKTNYVDSFARAVGSQHPTTRKSNFMALFDWHFPPGLVDTQKNNFTESVERVKAPMMNIIIAKVFQSTKIPLLRFYQARQDYNDQFDESQRRFLPSPLRIPSGTVYSGTDENGQFLSQAVVYHHWDRPGFDDDLIREFSENSLIGPITHLNYQQLRNIPLRAGQYWNPEESFGAAFDCQKKRTNGEFPQDWNGKTLYPKGVPIDFSTDIDNIGACSIWNTPVCSDLDSRLYQHCSEVLANQREGYCHADDRDFCNNLGGQCNHSWFENYIHDWTTLALYCLQQTGYLPENLDDAQVN